MAKHKYTILSMMKDEGHSLVEWVAYHTHIGFDNICVYTNNCGDGTDEMLIRLQELGWVKHFRNDVPEGKKPQPNALALATQNPDVIDSEWILTMDADEFVSIKIGNGRITDIIERMDPSACAMAITWRFFGSNGITDWNPGLVTESYTKGAPDTFKKGWGVKTLFKPYRDMKLGIHRPHIKKAKHEPENAKLLFDQLWLNGSGAPMPDEFSLSGWRSTKPTLGYNWVELNHYGVKSFEAYLLRRVRGNVNNKAGKYDASYFALFDRNEEEHLNITSHAEAVKEKMAQILSDPKMRELQDKALDFHGKRVEMLRASGEYDTWLTDLKVASEISLDKLDEVLFVQHLPKEWQEKVKELQAAGVPDKQIAKMISQTQTAKKGETRQALMASAGENAEEKLDAHQLKTKESKGDNLDNPFLNTAAAAGLGIPLMNERTQKIALAAQAADPNDARSNKLIVKAAIAKSVRDASADAPASRKVIINAKDLQSAIARPTDKQVTSAPQKAQPEPATKATSQERSQPRVRDMTDAPNAGRKVLVTTMKNEGPYVLEWLAYHKLIGIDEFCIFSNDCTDGTNLILNRLDRMGVVKHYDNPQGPNMDPQRSAYSRANQLPWVRSADWVLIVDADEFLNIHVGDRSVDALIHACGAPDAISVNWRLMGSQGQARMVNDPFNGQLVAERFNRGSSFENPENGLVRGFKTLFRPSVFDYFGVHRPRFRKDTKIDPASIRWTNAGGDPMGDKYLEKGWRSNDGNVSNAFAQVNHYAIKSREDFLLKRLRGTANSKNKGRIDMDYWGKYDINTERDKTIKTDGVRELMNTWLQDPDLAALARACADCSQRVLDYQLTVPAFQFFVDTGIFNTDEEDGK